MTSVDELAALFESRYGRAAKWVARAPGRVDLMGSHTDYNGGWVLTMPLDLELQIIAAPRNDNRIALYSLELESAAEWSFEDDPASAPEFLPYPAGVISLLRKSGRATVGFDGIVTSRIPVGGGLSSSAAFEAATAVLQGALGGWDADPKEMALLCQRAENEVVGVPCGVLDQFSSLLGVEGCVLLLDCRSLETQPVHLPAGYVAAICDTIAPRRLAGSEYTSRREDCERAAGHFSTLVGGSVQLRDVTPAAFEQGRGGLDPRVARRAGFIIEENQRVLSLANALAHDDRGAVRALCEASFSGAREGFEITVDAMEQLHAAMSTAPGCIGARQAGAGFGGCMVALVEASRTEEFKAATTEAYMESSGRRTNIQVVRPAMGASAARLPMVV